MRKHLLLYASIVISIGAVAQVQPSFGVKAGISSSDMRGDAVNSLQSLLEYTDGMMSTKSRTGFFAGANVNIPISENISVEPGLYYAQKGYELRGDISIKNVEFLGANAKAQLTSHYIDMPLLLKASLGGLQVFAGPQVSYLASADLRTMAGVLGFNLLNRTMDATEQFNRWDAGITGGLGYQFNNGLNISAAYDHGLSRADANKSLESYNRSIKLGVGFRF